ncbi:MAG TPA: two-component regulator propeller domain-containing protein, partial [Bacteroidales bacterium]|nr:two-component regulator propeller domain-containing protein [Bacteroidales bacterium]
MKKIYFILIALFILNIAKAQRWTTYTTSNGLVNNNIQAIAIDAQGNKWFGTEGGVSKFDGTNWTTYTTANGLTFNSVSAIAIDSQGNKWFGTLGGGISKFDGANWTTYKTANGLANNSVTAIAIDAQGNKWFGTEGGVSKFNGTNWTTYTTANGLTNNLVQAIAIDAKGNKWFGTLGGGISKFDGTNWTSYKTNNDLPTAYVFAIAIDNKGNKWFGTYGGVLKFDGANWTTYTTDDGLANNFVQAIAIDTKGNKWFATYNSASKKGCGVTKFDGINWITYTTNDGLANNWVLSIAIDAKGYKWFGTASSGGVTKFDDITTAKEFAEKQKEENDKNEKYVNLILQGDSAFKYKNYSFAQQQYTLALELKSFEEYPSKQIKEIKTILTYIKDRKTKVYDYKEVYLTEYNKMYDTLQKNIQEQLSLSNSTGIVKIQVILKVDSLEHFEIKISNPLNANNEIINNIQDVVNKYKLNEIPENSYLVNAVAT